MIGNQILKRQWIPSLINVVFQTLELPLFLISFCRDLRAFLLLAKAASTASRILLSSTICHKPRAVSRDNWAMHPTHSGQNRSIFLEESLAPNSPCCTWRLLKSGNTEAKSSIIHHKWMGQKWQKNWQTHCFIPMLPWLPKRVFGATVKIQCPKGEIRWGMKCVMVLVDPNC